MHQLFGIEYLVYEICSHASYHDLPVLARVSSTWFRCAITHLYKEVDIQNALAPLGIEECDYDIDDDDLDDILKDEDFKRFLKYRPYVRSLHVRVTLGYFDTVFVAVRKSVSKGFPYLFPNIRNLDWVCQKYSPEYMEISASLLSPKIDRLSLCLTDDRILHHLSPLIMTRLPVLYSISISDKPSIRNSVGESCLANPVQGLLTFFAQTLTSVEISPSLNTPSIIECLSNIHKLRNLAIGSSNNIGELGRSNGISGDGEKFPSLLSFSFDGSCQPLYDMFLKPYRLASLTTLTLDIKSPNSADVRMIVSSIATCCPRIRKLTIGAQFCTEALTSYAWLVVPWSFIQPISSCKELTALSLNRMRVSIDLDDLTEFLQSRTTWTCLHLLTSDPLRLQDIILYAKHCPDLEHLGIHLSNPIDFCINDLPVDLPTFSSLTSIDFCGSDIKKPTLTFLTRFLYRICKNPPYYIRGLGDPTNDHVVRDLAIHYVNEQYSTGMSNEVRKFVTTILERGKRRNGDGDDDEEGDDDEDNKEDENDN